MNPWNSLTQINFDEDKKRSIREWYDRIASFHKHKRKSVIESFPLTEDNFKYLRKLYVDDGIGIKLLARALDLSYSRMRVLLKDYLKIELRSHKDSTDFLKRIRSERVSKDKNPWYDWPSKNPSMHKSSRGIQGYYTSRSGKRIWLRSSWEYIYAKWLDKHKVDWKYEDYGITLSNGERYRPDFLIYENGILTKIVEIKGYFDNRRYKAEILKEDLKDKISVIIIDDIKDYCDGSGKDIETWKLMCSKSKE